MFGGRGLGSALSVCMSCMSYTACTVEPVIWIIDNNHWERVNIRAQLIEDGYRVEGFPAILPAIAGFYRGILERPALIILELRNLDYLEPELDELARIGAPIVLLTGVFEGNMELFSGRKWAAVLRRPFSVGQVVEAVERIIGEFR